MENQQPMVSIIVPAYNGRKTLAECLTAVRSSDYANYEIILVNDCSTDDTPEIARQYGAMIIDLEGGPYGPGYARNRGVEAASGEIVLFVDADVVIKPDTVTRVAGTFVDKPEISAMFGSYDDDPDSGDFSSQFKNLFHHFVHQQGHEQAVTFWSGCGAILRQAFIESGGFDAERYPHPSIEDIELGYRLTAAGHQIVVNKDVQVKHLKRWTIRGMVKADIFDRAIPWTQLILREKNLPNDLNLGLSQRASALLLLVLVVHLVWTAFFHNILVLVPLAALFFVMVSYWNNSENAPPLSRISTRAEKIMYLSMAMIAGLSIYLDRPLMLFPVGVLFVGTLMGKRFGMFNRYFRGLLFLAMIIGTVGVFSILVVNFNIWFLIPILGLVATIVALNIRFYAFFIRKRGFLFAFAVIPFHLLYYLYSIVTFALVTGVHTWNTSVLKK
ncbi:MAG: glycosyltransferase family 2 protein [Chloroflexi bacterium]|nr:glycosyltransferase family 2 protein [Chloroflexota bacterium]